MAIKYILSLYYYCINGYHYSISKVVLYQNYKLVLKLHEHDLDRYMVIYKIYY